MNAPPKKRVAEARLELIRDEIVQIIGPMQASLDAALAIAAIPNNAGFLYALRDAQIYWRHISVSAKEFTAVEAERQSAIRQRESGR